MTRKNKIAGAIFECDATRCHDRIFPALMALHIRRLGLQRNMAIEMLKILYTMKRFVGTKYGASKKYIQTIHVLQYLME